MLSPALLHRMIRHGEAWQDPDQKTLRSGVEGATLTHEEQGQTEKVPAAQASLTPPVGSEGGEGAPRTPTSDAERLRAEVEALKEKLRGLEQRLAESGER